MYMVNENRHADSEAKPSIATEPFFSNVFPYLYPVRSLSSLYSTYMGWIWVTEPELLAISADGV